ncbi:hypothetical protein AB0L13_46750 [Saccharopolyspora shandongensis]|uniref:hypothetical protein n=1 Tax=Saccharopolyspora shandongensis TaxID=418495 RepID=UPI003415FC76
MPFVKTLKRAGSSAIAAGVLASAAVLAAAAPAWADTGKLTVCSEGDYASYVEFPARGGMTTAIVNSGQCQDFADLGSSTDVEAINVFGIDGPSTFWITSGDFRPSQGGNVVTQGSSANASALTPRV